MRQTASTSARSFRSSASPRHYTAIALKREEGCDPVVARAWDNLSDYEFESLVADLLGADLGVRFERFTAGPDGGIDLRYIPPTGGVPDIVQAKHYKGSTMSSLRAAAKREAKRLGKGKVESRSYRLVTSLGLTPANKKDLAEILTPWITRDDHVLGRDDLEGMLDDHSEVERRNVKLWLGSGTQLAAMLQAGTHARSRALAGDIKRTLPLYVQGESFRDAHERLWEHRVLLIAGQPGIGKTTLARMLVADAIANDFEPVEVSNDIDEAWDVWDPEKRQVFLYDDFLGRTVLGELAKNEDSRLLSFMREVSQSANTLVMLTTREYILQEALRTFEAFRRAGLDNTRFLLSLKSYTRLERAKILHNHVWHSELPMRAKEELVIDRGYSRIVEHTNFNPRLIEYITGLQEGHRVVLENGDSWLDFAANALDEPNEIWRQAFERELGEVERYLLLCLATMPDQAQIDDLELTYDTWAQLAGLPTQPRRYETALAVVEDTFTTSQMREGGELFISVSNPSLIDFLQRQLMADGQLVTLALRSAAFIDQVQTVWRLLEKAPNRVRHDTLAASDMADAIDRLLESSGARWGRFSYGYREHRYRRFDATLDERLDWVIDVAANEHPPTGFVDLAERRLSQRVGEWRNGRGDALAAPRLARKLARERLLRPPDDWDEALVELVTHDPATVYQWESVVELMEVLPEQFDEVSELELTDVFTAFASDELTYHDDETESEDKLTRLEYVAESLGATLDEDEMALARGRIERRLQQQDAMDEQYEDERRGPSFDGASEAREMDAMFGRLIS